MASSGRNRHNMSMRLISLLVVLLLSACVHQTQTSQKSDAQSLARLDSYELSFASFISSDLNVDEVGQRRDPMVAIDQEHAKLQGLRLRYLRLLSANASPEVRAKTMMRIAELHLDLAARIRKASYPPELNLEERQLFEAQLSRVAAPLEATGAGVLQQMQSDLTLTQKNARFLERSSLYLSLHSLDEGAQKRLGAIQRAILQRELDSRAMPYAAPSRLLSRGRIGSRSARVVR